MPLSEDEQRILEEMERRLAEEDPRLVEHVTRTTLSVHLSRKIRVAALAFLLGFVMLFFVAWSVWAGVAGFVVMLASGYTVARYLRQLGRDQIRALQEEGRFSLGGILGRLAERYRGRPDPREE
jgi:hypothetical protein